MVEAETKENYESCHLHNSSRSEIRWQHQCSEMNRRSNQRTVFMKGPVLWIQQTVFEVEWMDHFIFCRSIQNLTQIKTLVLEEQHGLSLLRFWCFTVGYSTIFWCQDRKRLYVLRMKEMWRHFRNAVRQSTAERRKEKYCDITFK